MHSSRSNELTKSVRVKRWFDLSRFGNVFYLHSYWENQTRIVSSAKSGPGTVYYFHANVRATSQHTFERSPYRPYRPVPGPIWLGVAHLSRELPNTISGRAYGGGVGDGPLLWPSATIPRLYFGSFHPAQFSEYRRLVRADSGEQSKLVSVSYWQCFWRSLIAQTVVCWVWRNFSSITRNSKKVGILASTNE